MRNIIKSLSIISVATLTLISCGPGVQTTAVNTNNTTTTSSDSTTYENYEPVNITNSNATENTNYTNTTSKYGLLSSVLSSVDFTSLFAGIGSKMKEAAKQNSNCGQCTGSGCSSTVSRTGSTTSTPRTTGRQQGSTGQQSVASQSSQSSQSTSTANASTSGSKSLSASAASHKYANCSTMIGDYRGSRIVKSDANGNAIDYGQVVGYFKIDSDGSCSYFPKVFQSFDNSQSTSKANASTSGSKSLSEPVASHKYANCSTMIGDYRGSRIVKSDANGNAIDYGQVVGYFKIESDGSCSYSPKMFKSY